MADINFYDYGHVQKMTPASNQGIGIVLKSISLMVIICAGAIENAVIVYAVVRDRRLHKAPYYFVINLAIADLLRSVICLPFVQATVIHGSQWQYGSSACKLLAFASTFFIFGAAFALLVLAVDRYLSIIHHGFHAKKLRGLMCLSIVLLGWGVAFILAFPPVFGLGTYDFNPLENQCTFEHRHYKNNDTIGFVVIFLSTISLTLFLYGRILYFLRKHRRMKPIMCSPPRSQTWNFFRVAQGLAHQPVVQRDAGAVFGPCPGGLAVDQARAPAIPSAPPDQMLLQQAPPLLQPPPQGNPNNYMPMHQIPMQQLGLNNNNNQHTAPPPVTFTPHNAHYGQQATCMFSPSSLRPVAKERLTRAVFMMTLTYDFIWLPYVTATCWYLFGSQPRALISYDFITVATWLTYCQVALLPLVYIICHRPVRRHVLGSSSLDNLDQLDQWSQSNVSLDT